MEKNEKPLNRNQDGDIPTDIPSEKLKHPPKKHSGKQNRSSSHNATAKDPLLGSRHATR